MDGHHQPGRADKQPYAGDGPPLGWHGTVYESPAQTRRRRRRACGEAVFMVMTGVGILLLLVALLGLFYAAAAR